MKLLFTAQRLSFFELNAIKQISHRTLAIFRRANQNVGKGHRVSKVPAYSFSLLLIFQKV